MMFLAAHEPDGLLAPGGLLDTSHRFLFKVGGRNTTGKDRKGSEQGKTLGKGGREEDMTAEAVIPGT